MTLKERIIADLRAAMKAGDATRRDTLRMLDSAIKNAEIEKKKREEGLTDEEVLEVVMRSVKQRQDSVRQFEDGGRPELAEKEKVEIAILSDYMPKQLSTDELRVIAESVIVQSSPVSKADFGKVMGEIMRRVKGQADGNAVRAIVEELLG